MTVWSGRRIAGFVSQPPEIKVNPNGVDLKASEVWLILPDAVSVLKGSLRETTPAKPLSLTRAMISSVPNVPFPAAHQTLIPRVSRTRIQTDRPAQAARTWSKLIL